MIREQLGKLTGQVKIPENAIIAGGCIAYCINRFIWPEDPMPEPGDIDMFYNDDKLFIRDVTTFINDNGMMINNISCRELMYATEYGVVIVEVKLNRAPISTFQLIFSPNVLSDRLCFDFDYVSCSIDANGRLFMPQSCAKAHFTRVAYPMPYRTYVTFYRIDKTKSKGFKVGDVEGCDVIIAPRPIERSKIVEKVYRKTFCILTRYVLTDYLRSY
jgi:hypothetical protein